MLCWERNVIGGLLLKKYSGIFSSSEYSTHNHENENVICQFQHFMHETNTLINRCCSFVGLSCSR